MTSQLKKIEHSPLFKGNHSALQEEYTVKDNLLSFHNISLKHLIEKYGSSLKLTYLPKIRQQIQKGIGIFNQAIEENEYQGAYSYGYCSKSNYFKHTLNTVLSEQVFLETSSAFDINLILHLFRKKEIDNTLTIIHNGYKTDQYLKNILKLQSYGFRSSIIVLDNVNELKRIEAMNPPHQLKVGLRMATLLKGKKNHKSSRLGIPREEIIPFFKESIQHNSKVALQMFHFFVDNGINDTKYYWEEFEKALSVYSELKKESTDLNILNLGGGFPIPKSFQFDYDYQAIADKIIYKIKEHCLKNNISEPNIYSEFGQFTVGESGVNIFEVLEEKTQNGNEKWYMVNNSIINTIPDTWFIKEKFVLLPINKWNAPWEAVNIGGITCDSDDYYNSAENTKLFLPQISEEDKEPLYLAFFNTGAYQDAIGGYGGINHCLIPSSSQVVIDIDEHGEVIDYLYKPEQRVEDMLEILGYSD
jgi:arginine decarboxylase